MTQDNILVSPTLSACLKPGVSTPAFRPSDPGDTHLISAEIPRLPLPFSNSSAQHGPLFSRTLTSGIRTPAHHSSLIPHHIVRSRVNLSHFPAFNRRTARTIGMPVGVKNRVSCPSGKHTSLHKN